MIPNSNRPSIIKKYARQVLVLFVLSIMNMAYQLPAHAAMQQAMVEQAMVSMPASMMSDMRQTMRDCDCPPAVCDAVAAQNDQNIESLNSASVMHMLGFQSVYSSLIEDAHHQPSTILLNYHEWQYRQFSPPPLSLSSILHI